MPLQLLRLGHLFFPLKKINVGTQRSFVLVDKRMLPVHKGFLPQARERAEIEGFEISVAKTSFKANTKALAENEGEGLAEVVFQYSWRFKMPHI
ncbi:hypothetical protein ACSBR1_029426 [Camellia fascicularis]